jgi:hypothetical protein
LKLVRGLSAVQVVGGKAPTNLKGPKKSGPAMPPSIWYPLIGVPAIVGK